MTDLLAYVSLGVVGLFLGYTLALGISIGIIAYCQTKNKPVPKLLKSLSGF